MSLCPRMKVCLPVPSSARRMGLSPVLPCPRRVCPPGSSCPRRMCPPPVLTQEGVSSCPFLSQKDVCSSCPLLSQKDVSCSVPSYLVLSQEAVPFTGQGCEHTQTSDLVAITFTCAMYFFHSGSSSPMSNSFQPWYARRRPTSWWLRPTCRSACPPEVKG